MNSDIILDLAKSGSYTEYIGYYKDCVNHTVLASEIKLIEDDHKEVISFFNKKKTYKELIESFAT